MTEPTGFPEDIGDDDFLAVEEGASRNEFASRARGRSGSEKGEVARHPSGIPAADLALQFVAAQEMRCVYWRGDLYRYTGTHYEPVPDGDLKAEVLRFLQEGDQRRRAGARLASDVVANLQASCLLPTKAEPPVTIVEGSPVPLVGEFLPMRNGLLNLGTLSESEPTVHHHDPDIFITSALPFDFDPKAAPPEAWFRFLDDLFDDDQESRDALQEWFGYCLTADTRYQKIFLITGPKRSGKGTIARVLTALLGPGNVVAPTLASLERTFGLQPLIGKKLSVIGDARLGSRADQAAVAEELLSISGEDTRTIHRKHLPSWTGRLFIRFMMLTNELPRIADASGALASRFIILTLQESFLDREDHGLADRLLAELPAIGNWALEGLQRLRARGRFFQPSASREAVQDLETLGSPISAFLRDRCELVSGRETEIRKLYEAWRAWCENQGRDHPGNLQGFCRDLKAAEPRLRVTQPREGGGRVRKYSGIRLLDEWEMARDGTRSNSIAGTT